ncbi:MAG: TetR family transcriptional regulator [Streptosporangiales bacterium]|nr:TetR family transcriptional regulator [Streptosporangiales bacterium]
MKTDKRSYRMTSRASAAERTHGRILAAAREQFLAAPYDDVTLSTIAQEAGVTQQTVLNHFESKENLFAVLVEGVAVEVDDRRGTARVGDTAASIRVLLREYEEIGDAIIRFLALEDRMPVLADVLASGRTKHRAWLEQVFADRLPADTRARRHTLTTLYAATDIYVWKLLRRDLDNSLAETARVMQRLVTGALAP